MKKNLYLYLFIFASLIALIFYVNGRKYQTQLEQKIVELKKEADKQEEKLETVQAQIAIADFITIKGNPEAENYFLKYNLTSSQVEALLYDKLLELNIKDGGNPLIPYIGANRGFAIDQIQTLNPQGTTSNILPKYQKKISELFGYEKAIFKNTSEEIYETAVMLGRRHGYKMKKIP